MYCRWHKSSQVSAFYISHCLTETFQNTAPTDTEICVEQAENDCGKKKLPVNDRKKP